jgi:hypothetical protein
MVKQKGIMNCKNCGRKQLWPILGQAYNPGSSLEDLRKTTTKYVKISLPLA